MNDNIKSALLANLSLVVLILLCVLFVEGIKATSQQNSMSSNHDNKNQHQMTEQERLAEIAKRHHQPDIHRETRDRLKDLLGDAANVQQNPTNNFKQTLGGQDNNNRN